MFTARLEKKENDMLLSVITDTWTAERNINQATSQIPVVCKHAEKKNSETPSQCTPRGNHSSGPLIIIYNLDLILSNLETLCCMLIGPLAAWRHRIINWWATSQKVMSYLQNDPILWAALYKWSWDVISDSLLMQTLFSSPVYDPFNQHSRHKNPDFTQMQMGVTTKSNSET